MLRATKCMHMWTLDVKHEGELVDLIGENTSAGALIEHLERVRLRICSSSAFFARCAPVTCGCCLPIFLCFGTESINRLGKM